MLAVVAIVWLLLGRDDDTVAQVQPAPAVTVEPTPTQEATPEPTGEPEAEPTTAPESQPEPAPEPDPEPPTLTGATYGPFFGWPTSDISSGSWIADVRTAAHAGYDRVVVEFDGDYVPSYEVAYTTGSGPFRDIPGDIVPVAGDAFVDVWLKGTSRWDLSNDYEPVYAGPTRVRSDTVAVTEVVETEDFEANAHWIIGLDERRPFVVWTIDDPSRLVIDIRSSGSLPQEPASTIPGASYGPFSDGPMQRPASPSWVVDVRSAGHAGYDRVVFEFDGAYVPWFTAAYDTPAPGGFNALSGDVVPVSGGAFIEVWLEGMSTYYRTEESASSYAGPTRLRTDTAVVTEVAQIQQFDGQAQWVIGVDHPVRFVTRTLDSPSRLVIDIES